MKHHHIEGWGSSLAHSPWRLTIALAALVAVAALAVFSLNTPVQADAHQPKAQFGSCEPQYGPGPEECENVLAPVMGLKAIQISSGTSFALSLGSDGTISCWGETDAVEAILCDVPDFDVQRGNNVRLTADGKAVVALDAHGRPEIDETGQKSAKGNRYLVDQEEVRWSQVAAGNRHSCGITTEGEVYCWGSSRVASAIQIPIGILARQQDREMPSPRFYKVVAGDAHTCVLEHEANVDATTGAVNMGDTEIRAGQIAAGSIVCWGDNSSNQTDVPGDPHPVHRPPLPPGSARTSGDAGGPDSDGTAESEYLYVDVTAGANHTCAVRTSGIVDCWGSDSHGQSSVPMQLRVEFDPPSQQAVIGPDGQLTTLEEARQGRFHSIEAGENYTCAINAEGGALCWGASIGANPSEAETESDAGTGGTGETAVSSLGFFGGTYTGGQEYPPAGEYTQISAGRWHACAIHTWDDFPMRAVNPEAPEPATLQTVEASGKPSLQISLSDGARANLDCWGNDAGPDGSGGLIKTGRAVPPSVLHRRVVNDPRPARFVTLGWNQISAGGTFSCGIVNIDNEGVGSPPPTSAGAADGGLFSATAAVEEGMVACWGLIDDQDVPSPHSITTAVVGETCESGDPAVIGYKARIPDGWGKIHGRVSDEGGLQLAFSVIQNGPDFWIQPEFGFVPSQGNMAVGRWYYSELMTVPRYADPGTAKSLADAPCDCGDMPVGRLAVRLLPTGHWELALATASGTDLRPAILPDNHNRVPTPAETGKWWTTDWIKWYDAP